MALCKSEHTQEVAQSKESISPKKTGSEWEIFAKIAMKLHQIDDAKEGYNQCLEQKLSTSALFAIIDLHASEAAIIPCLHNIARLVICQERTFSEETYPSPIANALFKLIHGNGLIKVQNALVSMNVSVYTYKSIT